MTAACANPTRGMGVNSLATSTCRNSTTSRAFTVFCAAESRGLFSLLTSSFAAVTRVRYALAHIWCEMIPCVRTGDVSRCGPAYRVAKQVLMIAVRYNRRTSLPDNIGATQEPRYSRCLYCDYARSS
jgi:hypothetical protein